MNRLLKNLLSIVICFSLTIPMICLTGCGGKVFRISNCEDYIDEELLSEFEDYYSQKTGEKIQIEYTTFGTLEELYTNMKRGDKYDLVCPSDYMIEKLAREGMLQPLNLSETGTYNTLVSPYIKSVLESVKWGEDESLAKYSAGYMWGTLGLVYNSAKITDVNDMKSWSSLWLDKYKTKFSIKDSMRDTYFIGLAKNFKQELETAKNNYKNNTITLSDYKTILNSCFNNVDANVISAVEQSLLDLKDRSWGLEVDSGKNDIVSGNIDIYFAWSGDAVYAMDEAEEDGVYLNYEVPEEGSNVWFDGWCVPKGSENIEIAKEFIEFISTPESVKRNMEYIGYVSCIAGDEIFDYVQSKYASKTNGAPYVVDLSYFFGEGSYAVATETINRQFSAQYPSKEVIDRCVIMNYFNDEANDKITSMWAKISVSN